MPWPWLGAVRPQSWWRWLAVLSRAFFPRGRGEGEGEGEGPSLARVTSVRLAFCSRASNPACHTTRSRVASHHDRRGSEALEPASGRPTLGHEVPAPSADRGSIADLCCRHPKLVIEVDGGQHAERTAPDAARTRMIAQHGYTVLRFWDDEVLENAEGVLEAIAPSPSPLPR